MTLARVGAWRAGLLLAILGFFALPIVYLLSVSFKTKDDVLSGAFLPQSWTLSNWQQAFEVIPLTTFVGHSIWISVLAGVLTIVITLPAAYATLRLGVARRWLPQTVLGSYMAPPVVAMIPMFYFLKHVGLLNSVSGLILVNALINVPVAFWLLTPFLRRIPIEIEQAASLDGAGPLRTLVSVVAPMIAPGIVATGIIVVVLSYNEFLLASTLSMGDASRTLTVGISLFQGDRLVNFGQMAAASLVGILPVYFVALFMQRHLIEGLAHGGVK
jgi:multiple sugar transport system permease protein